MIAEQGTINVFVLGLVEHCKEVFLPTWSETFQKALEFAGEMHLFRNKTVSLL